MTDGADGVRDPMVVQEQPDLSGRTVVVISPHYDDVPLSLGQSLLDGALSRAASVQVKVVFGRTNWSVQVHPTRRRAPVVTGWRRAEEALAARRFGYSVEVAGFEEVILRSGDMDPAGFRGDHDPRVDPLFLPVLARLREWRRGADELWVPAGLGRHLDHVMVAFAGARLVGESGAGEQGGAPIAFYEDRPYVSYLDDAELAGELGRLGLDLAVQAVSDPVRQSTQELVRRCYRSQMDEMFVAAQERDRALGSRERVWRPAASGPPRRLRDVTDG